VIDDEKNEDCLLIPTTLCGRFLYALVKDPVGAGEELSRIRVDGYATDMLPALVVAALRLAARLHFGDVSRSPDVVAFANDVSREFSLDAESVVEEIAKAVEGAALEYDSTLQIIYVAVGRMSSVAPRLDEVIHEAERRVAAMRNEVFPARLYPAPSDNRDDTAESFVDYGSIQIPKGLIGADYRVDLQGTSAVAAIVGFGPAGIRMESYSAPFGPIWDRVRGAALESGSERGEDVAERSSRFGAEVVVRREGGVMRMIGREGPGWLLRGTILVPDGTDPEAIAVIERMFEKCKVRLPRIALLPEVALPLKVPDEV